MKYVIGIDLGTSGVKVVLFDEFGSILSNSSREYPLYQPVNGWAEQQPEEWWTATLESLRETITKSNILKKDIVGLGISGQMHGLVMLDEQGKVLRPAIIWCDQRTSIECEEITNIIGKDRLIEITANPALPGFTASKIMWVKKHEPEIFSRCKHILLPKDYIRYRLSGDFATEMSDASGMQLLDVKNRCWSEDVLDKLDIDKEKLCKLYESPEITGYISKDVAEITGLSENTIIVGGAGDNAAAAVGTGVVKQGMAFTTIGTSGVVYAHTDKPIIDAKGRVHTFCCAVPNAWHVMGVTQGAGLSLQWLKNNICISEINEAKKNNKSVYQIMDAEAGKIPLGSEKLIYLPYLMGERTPHLDSNARGVFFGLSALHTRAHLIRSVMEGVTYSLYDCMLILEEMNVLPDVMLATGGGGKSPFWRQMLSDTFSRPVSKVLSAEAPALGVAILAAVGAGLYSSVEEACSNMIKNDTCLHQPDAQNTLVYRNYHRIYQSLYASLKDNFIELSKL